MVPKTQSCLGYALLDAIGGSVGEVFYIYTLEVHVRKYYDLFFVEVAHLSGDDQVVVGVLFVELYDILVPSEVAGHLAIE